MTAPIKAPVNGTLWVARKVEEAANRELNDPATLRQTLHELEQQLLSGQISEEDYDAAETDLLVRLKAQP
ncbi:gas vesicle protein GvpG [Yoonia sp. F2084L]|uniref:gas vesicle protein GvpG n=1 Tax=Yoonia sp. F2084L TaxID=2926419 RepID=UPI001FF51E6E|nr:gas vesicle protein GvpG [Yoonia sp. F2084L]